MILVSNAALKAVESIRAPKLMFVGRQDLQTKVLAQYLSDALKTSCHFDDGSRGDAIAQEDVVTLIDCMHHDHEAIDKRLEKIYQKDASNCAVLLNANLDAGIEELIHWPCLKGVFFADGCHAKLLEGMKRVLLGELWIPRRLLEQSFERQRLSRPPRTGIKTHLSRRELDILRCISRAKSNSDIARKLHISEHTVKTHIYNIFRKIEVKNRTEASHWAMMNLPQPA